MNFTIITYSNIDFIEEKQKMKRMVPTFEQLSTCPERNVTKSLIRTSNENL